MREIKFRVWNVEEMGEVITVDWLEKKVVYLRKGDKEMFSAYFKDCKLMEYTGLKDKDGIEIYEGDILIDRHTEELCQIEFEEGKFVASFSTYVTDLSEVYQDLEIVGNIYENSELLEG